MHIDIREWSIKSFHCCLSSLTFVFIWNDWFQCSFNQWWSLVIWSYLRIWDTRCFLRIVINDHFIHPKNLSWSLFFLNLHIFQISLMEHLSPSNTIALFINKSRIAKKRSEVVTFLNLSLGSILWVMTTFTFKCEHFANVPCSHSGDIYQWECIFWLSIPFVQHYSISFQSLHF